MKKPYDRPELTIEAFAFEDILTSSGIEGDGLSDPFDEKGEAFDTP